MKQENIIPGGFCGFHSTGGIVTVSSGTLDDSGNFNVCIQLKTTLGFAEDCRKVTLNMQQKLVLIKNNSDKNAAMTWNDRNADYSKEPKVQAHLDKIY